MTSARFEGQAAVVTGAGGGAGQATARQFAREGAAVAVADIRPDAAQATVDLITADGGTAIAVVCDVSDETSVRELVGTTMASFGRLDILHNNAAALGADVYGRDVAIAELEMEVWDRTFAVNTRGVVLGCKHAVPAMKATGGGAIVNTVSVGAMHGGNDHASYGASKAAVISVTRYVAAMYGRDSIRCNAVAPGLILSQTALDVLSAHQLAEFEIERALPWAADPEDIAEVVTWLASRAARCITGETIVVDSGVLARRPRDVMQEWGAYLASQPA